jgi:hypothetical protein
MKQVFRRRLFALAVAAFVLAVLASAPGALGRGSSSQGNGPGNGGQPRIVVLSNRADLISGGEALVQIVLPGRIDPSDVTVRLNGSDVTSAFAVRSDGDFVGLVTGLNVGRNDLRASMRKGPTVHIAITNHPIGGPVFAGPQVQPWICKTIAGFPAPTDAQCDSPTVFSFVFKDATTGAFAPYDPASPPPSAQIATTTTDQGVTVPYIVRVERGAMDRGLYDLAVLSDPSQPWAPWASQSGWDHKLLYQFGGGTAPHHSNGAPMSDLVDLALARGFMVANNSLNTRGQNSNDVVSAEAMMMLKEHIAESYGSIRYTIGAGCSGGSIQQQVIAADYPGLLDGIQPNCSYQDSWTTGNEVGDCHLLLHYFAGNPAAGFTNAQQVAVMGEQTAPAGLRVCDLWEATFASVATPFLATNCDMAAPPYNALVYNPVTNPTGVRCTPQDYESAVWGFRPQDGFAKRPFDNVGIEYGLGALGSGAISPEQFVDLNQKIGGVDIDNQFQSARTVGDPGSEETAYRAGKVTNGHELANVPIIDLRGSHNVLDIHSDYHSYVMRARLDEDNGNHRNQIIWTWQGGPGLFQAITPDATIASKSFLLMDSWLAAIEADTRSIPLSRKVVAHKPADAVDACFIGPTDNEITDPATCNATYPHFADPRIVAGSPLADNVMKCRLKRLRPGDFPVMFSADQWTRLQQAFPDGVCDWTKQAVGERPSVSWLDYSNKIGGVPLGPAPESRPGN